MELKVGMWVITNDRMEIGKIKDFCTCEMCEERGFYEPIIDNPNIFITNYDKECKFHGYKFYDNIIDLIQIGDYVNGVEVIGKEFDNFNKEYLQCGVGDYVICTFEVKDIKTILTKEQYENNCYKVDDKQEDI